MKPKISIIMPVFNQDKYLKNSILSIINQSFRDFELIVIDDGSTDGSRKIIKIFDDKRLKVIYNKKNMGLTKSINIGLKNAKGEFIARMDGDDIALKHRLRLQISEFLKSESLYLLGGQAILINENGKKLKLTTMPTAYKTLKSIAIRYNPFIHPTIMFRKKLIKQIGFYNENFHYAQDYDFILRVLANYESKNLKLPILKLRISTGSISIAKHNKQQLTAVAIRLRAIFKYNYSLINLLFIIKPLISALVPMHFKRFIYPNLY